jgi:hypothetical protein
MLSKILIAKKCSKEAKRDLVRVHLPSLKNYCLRRRNITTHVKLSQFLLFRKGPPRTSLRFPIQSVSGHTSEDIGSDRLQSLRDSTQPSLFSDVTPRSKVAKHVQFTFKDNASALLFVLSALLHAFCTLLL